MLADKVFDVIIFLIQRLVLPVMPIDFLIFSFHDFETSLSGISGMIIKSFSGISNVFPVELVLYFVIIFLTAEVALFGIKSIFWLINVFRGSGA
jgi:hypothetical protein